MVLTKLKEIVNSAMDARFLRKLDGESAVMELFGSQFYTMTREHSAMQLAPRCLPEVRIGIKGVVACAGVRLSMIAGNTLREKTAALGQLTLDVFLKLASAVKFVIEP